MSSMTQDFKKNFKKYLGIFLLLFTFEIFSHYSNIDSSHWPKEDVQWITDKIFIKNYGLNGFETFFLHFSIEFLVFAFFVIVLIVIRLIVIS